MKIGILTFHYADNYGAVLQIYALQQAIKNQGNESVVIDYRSAYIEQGYKVKVLPEKGITVKKQLKMLVINILNYKKALKRKKAFENFRDKYLILSSPVNNATIHDIEQKYEVILCGSDQIWNEEIIDTIDKDIYTLEFVKKTRKVSYAASAGSSETLSDSMLHKIMLLDNITVREESLARQIHNYANINVSVVCDPVLLLSEGFWKNQISGIPVRKRRTLLLYYIDSNRQITCNVANYIGRKQNLQVMYSACRNKYTLFHGRCVYEEDPLEFLAEIMHAEYVVASSFHAVVFSVIFHKKFVTVLHQNTGERVKDFLAKIGLENRIVIDLEDYCRRESQLEFIDYEQADKILKQWKHFSYAELDKLCSAKSREKRPD